MKFLVDFENVSALGLQGIKNLTKNDDILIFYTDTSRISFDMHRTIERLECRKDYQKITSEAQNALVFLLSTIIGKLIASDNKSSYAIISKDPGFDVIIQYWKSLGIRISRKTTIKEAMGLSESDHASAPATAPASANEEVKTNDIVNDIFPGNTDPEIDINNLLNTRFSGQ